MAIHNSITWIAAVNAAQHLRKDQKVLIFFFDEGFMPIGKRICDAYWDGTNFRVTGGIVHPTYFTRMDENNWPTADTSVGVSSAGYRL